MKLKMKLLGEELAKGSEQLKHPVHYNKDCCVFICIYIC